MAAKTDSGWAPYWAPYLSFMLLVEIGGTQVFKYDGRHPCESNGAVDVNVPEAGWYEIEAIWFQRIGSACLLMQWGEPGGDLGWTPNDAFAHKP